MITDGLLWAVAALLVALTFPGTVELLWLTAGALLAWTLKKKS